MYLILLTLHSLVRWLILISLLVAVARAWWGWRGNKAFLPIDHIIKTIAVSIAHLQLVLGIGLYCISPLVRYFLSYFNTAVHERQPRFFGMEHITVMLIAVVLITIGGAMVKKQKEHRQRFRLMAIFFTIALLLILSSIPWQFSPLISRPYYRWF